MTCVWCFESTYDVWCDVLKTFLRGVGCLESVVKKVVVSEDFL